MKQAIKIWMKGISLVKKHPIILLPFVLVVIFNLIAIFCLYLAPQRPVSHLLAPVVRAFAGEKFLHYPLNLFKLPQLVYYVTIFISSTFAVLMTGLSVGMVSDTMKNQEPKIWSNFLYAFKRYFALLTVWLISFFVTFLIMKSTESIGLKAGVFPHFSALKYFIFFLKYVLLVFFQSIFMFVVPVLIIKKANIINSFKDGFMFLMRFFMVSMFLFIVPTLINFPIFVLKHKFPALVDMFFPEIILVVLFLGAIVSFVIDVFITIGSTIIFLDGNVSGEATLGGKDG